MKSAELAQGAQGLAGRVNAPAGWRSADFLSDLHLAANTPATLQALQAHLRHTRADAVFLLGDIFDAWIGDDARVEGFEAQCCAMLREASQRLPLFFMAGNRDFLLGPDMAADAGLQRLQDPCVLQAFGRRILLSHGDALCLADLPYQQFRQQVHSPAWRQQVLAQPLAWRRELARNLRGASRQNQQDYSESNWVDLDAPACIRLLQDSGCELLLHGHTHHPAVHELKAAEGGQPALTRWVLSDWDFDTATPRADVLRLDAEGLRRIPPEQG